MARVICRYWCDNLDVVVLSSTQLSCEPIKYSIVRWNCLLRSDVEPVPRKRVCKIRPTGTGSIFWLLPTYRYPTIQDPTRALVVCGRVVDTRSTTMMRPLPPTGGIPLWQQQQQQLQSQPLLGSWKHSSAAASSPHDPLLTLASHSIRSVFGGIVQTVADCLQCRGELSWNQLVKYVSERGNSTINRNLEGALTPRQIRAALLVLLQHSIVTAHPAIHPHHRAVTTTTKSSRNHPSRAAATLTLCTYTYRFHPSAAVHGLRHCRFIDYVRKAAGVDAAMVVEELLLAGRLRTVDIIRASAAAIMETTTLPPLAAPSSSIEHNPTLERSEEIAIRTKNTQTAIESLTKLVQAGFIEAVAPLNTTCNDEEDEDDGEAEFEPSPKRLKVSADSGEQINASDLPSTDPLVLTLLQEHKSRNFAASSILSVDTVWRVNVPMFHDTLRAYFLGKLVSERHGHAIPMAGSLVTAALKYRAHVRHSVAVGNLHTEITENSETVDDTVFAVHDILPFLPKSVLQAFEEKEGDSAENWMKAWLKLSQRTNPATVRRVSDDRFEIAVGSLTNYLTDRILFQVMFDRHGEVAARVASILLKKGYLESDRLAETAMVPSKDTREVLHHLFRSRYVELVQLSSSRQYNPSNAIFVWGVERTRLRRKITDHVAKALGNIRLRREHEVEVIGKNWIERAQQAADTDENDHETDKRDHQMFRLGLERLDAAALQLDETLMALCDF